MVAKWLSDTSGPFTKELRFDETVPYEVFRKNTSEVIDLHVFLAYSKYVTVEDYEFDSQRVRSSEKP